MTCEFTQPSNLPVADGTYRLLDTYHYCWDLNGQQSRITVPEGFTYDGASVPRLAWTLSGITPDGLIRAAALIHDWIYNHAGALSRPAASTIGGTGSGAPPTDAGAAARPTVCSHASCARRGCPGSSAVSPSSGCGCLAGFPGTAEEAPRGGAVGHAT